MKLTKPITLYTKTDESFETGVIFSGAVIHNRFLCLFSVLGFVLLS